MFEKVNAMHPDKVADRIAGAMVDLAYGREDSPRVAVEVLIGHGFAYVIAESSVQFTHEDVQPIINRIAGQSLTLRLLSIPQDAHLADNQHGTVKAGDNGIFKGMPVTKEQQLLTDLAGEIYKQFPTDGKYIIGRYRLRNKESRVEPSQPNDRSLALTICQSGAKGGHDGEILDWWQDYGNRKCWGILEKYTFRFGRTDENKPRFISLTKVNPLGEWTGGPDVDCGATNRKLGSDMGDGVTGGGTNGKDLSKADVTLNILCHLYAQEYQCPTHACCSIGDETVTIHCDREGDPLAFEWKFADAVRRAHEYIKSVGGFEKFSEWGLIRPNS